MALNLNIEFEENEELRLVTTDQLQDVLDAYYKGQSPPEYVDLDVWADKKRYLNEITGEKWKTARVEVARGPMKAVTEPGVRTITAMCCTQILKALDIRTPIPTPGGFVPMGDIKVGDQVYDDQGNVCNVTNVSGIMQGKECFEITFSDRSKIIADKDHTWLVYDYDWSKRKEIEREVTTLEISKTYKTYQNRNRYSIKLAKPVSGQDQALPIDPYVLGAWLGDGHSYSAHITKGEKDSFIFDKIRAAGFVLTEKERSATDTVTYHFEFKSPVWGKKTVNYYLTELELLKGKNPRNKDNKKHIPEIYLNAKEKDRWSLLQGIMDTDGTITKLGRASIATKSEVLARDIEKLVCSLGLKLVMKESFLKCGYKYFQGSFTPYRDQPVFSLPRKRDRQKTKEGARVSETLRRRIVSVEPVESRAVQCITVDSPNSLFLAGHQYVPTHNTELLLNVAGYYIDVDPCPIMVVQPNDGMARKFSDVRFKKMVKATPALRDKFKEGGKYAPANTLSFKEFPGGYLVMVGAKSPSNLAMLPIRILLCDEIDKWDADVGGEGNPLSLAEERQATFSTNSLAIRVCSPTIAGESMVEAEYDKSDKRRPFVACPHCHSWQTLKWPNVIWDKDAREVSDPETVNYKCQCCGVLWNEAERLRALKNVQWRQTAEFVCKECSHVNQPEKWDESDLTNWKTGHHVYIAHCESCGKGKCSNRHAGFWVNKLYSPFRPLSELVDKWIKAQGNVEKLKAFINTQLAETWQPSGDSISNKDGLMSRREKYDGPLPMACGLVTLALDVQGVKGSAGRIEGLAQGWALDEECYNLRRFIIPGDPSQPEIWQKVLQEIEYCYERPDGKVTYPAAITIDLGGGFTHEVAMFCRDKIERRVWPIRGMASTGRAIPIWPKKPGRTDRIQVPFYNVGVNQAKNVVFGRLLNDRPGPAYYHFNLDPNAGFDADFFEQLTAEKRVLKYKGTQRYYVWENKQRKRNEAWDLTVYNYAALCGLMSEGMILNEVIENDFFMLDSEYEPPEPDKPKPDISSSSTKRNSKPAGRRTRRVVRSNVMN